MNQSPQNPQQQPKDQEKESPKTLKQTQSNHEQEQIQQEINMRDIKLKIKQKPVEPWVIQDIIQNNNLHPTKDWNDQFNQDLHRTILNSEMQDTKALGSLVGVAVVGLIGFALSFTVIGFVVGSIFGIVMGGYAGKRIKRKKSKFKGLIHFDLFMINVACYYGVLYDEIMRNKGSIQLNNFRFKIQKCLQEYRGVEIFSKLSINRQKGFRSEMVRLVKLLQCQEAFKAMYLIYKLTKTIIKKTENQRTETQEYEIQVMLITIIKPLVTILQICDSKLNYDQKYLLQKLQNLAYSYDSLVLYDKLPENLILNQKEFLEKMDRKVNVEELKNNFKAFNLDKLVEENQQKNQENGKKQMKLIDLIQEQYEQQEQEQKKEQNVQQDQQQENENKLNRKSSDDSVSCSSIDSDDIQGGNGQLKQQNQAKKQDQEIENISFQQPEGIINNPNHQKINIQMNQSNPKSNYQYFSDKNNKNDIDLNKAKKKSLNPAFNKPVQINQHNNSFIPNDITSDFSSKKNSERQHNSNNNIENNQNLNVLPNTNQFQINDQYNNKNNNQQELQQPDKQIINIDNVPIQHYEQEEITINKSQDSPKNYTNNNRQQTESKDFLIQQSQSSIKQKTENNSKDYNSNNQNQINSNNQIEINIGNDQNQENNENNRIESLNEDRSEKALASQSDDMIEKLQFLMNIYEETIEQGKWKNVINKKEIEIFKKTNLESAAVMIRCHCFLQNCSALEIFNCIYDAKDRASWDKLLLGFTRVEQLNQFTDVIYSYVDPGFGVTKREWVQKRFYKFDYPKKGQITIVYYSVEHPLYPKKKGFIRADSYIAGYVMENVGNDCKLFILSCNDIKGLIPKYIVNFMAARAPKDWVNNLQKYIQKCRKDEEKKAIKK